MQKVDGVEKVRVSLKEGLTILDLKADNRVTVAKLREIIKYNGFVSRDAIIRARGVVSSANPNSFEVNGTGERLPISGRPTAEGDLWRLTSPSK